jgi:hypothetical protein
VDEPFYNDNRLSRQATEPALWKEIEMGHIVNIHSDEQFIQAIRILDKLRTTWQGIGPSSAPRLLLTDAQYNALVEAGVVPANDKEVKARGKKATGKKTKS